MAKRVDNKKQYRTLWIIIAVILCVTFAAAAVLFALNYVDSGVDPVSEMRAKNVILLIGDGMGFNHIKAGNIYSGSRLQMERFAVSGEVMTRSLTPGATDSAAAATAMATGIKTYNGRIAYKDGKNLTTVAEMAMAEGKKVGVVVTKAVTDATPAAFLTHASDRGETQSIAEQLVNSDVDVLFTGDLSDALGEGCPGDEDWRGVALEARGETQGLHNHFPENEKPHVFAAGFMVVNARRWRETRASLKQQSRSLTRVKKGLWKLTALTVVLWMNC